MGASSLPSGSSNVSCNAGSEAAFFYPGDDRLTGYTEGPLKPPQAAALLIGMQDLLPAFFWIRMWCGILSALSAAGTAEIFLLSIGRSTITHQCITPAMRTTNNDSDHGAFHLSHVSWSYAITSFSFLPLPKCVQQPAGFRHFTEVCEVDSPVSRRFPPIRLKNRRTFALFTRSFRAWLFASLDFPRVYTTQNRGKCKSRTEAGSVELCNKGPVTIWLDSADL